MLARTAVVFLLLVAPGCRRADEQPSPAVLAEARRELEARGRADQKVRESFGVGGQLDTAQLHAMMRTDSANTNWLKSHVARWGWPTRAQVGPEAVNSAFLIAQHAVHDTGFMRAMLPHIRESHQRGELDGNAIAMLIDRLEVKAGRPQVYGTQLSMQNGRVVLDPIGDSANVDERRRSMGMMPLKEYLRRIDSAMKAP